MWHRCVGLFVAAALAAAVWLGDWQSKAWAARALATGPRPLLDGWLSLTFIRNQGVGFSLLAAWPHAVEVLDVVVIIGMAIWLAVPSLAGWGRWVGGGLALGGALGNLTERLSTGGVSDFLAVRNWTVFNVADAAVVVGLGLWVLFDLRAPSDHG